MQSQERRDEKRITIATALCLFIVVVTVGTIAGWAVETTFRPGRVVDNALGVAFWCAAGVIPIAYLIRSIRR